MPLSLLEEIYYYVRKFFNEFRWIRLATVFGYIVSVCSPAVGLSIYYIYIWDPRYIVKFPSEVNVSKIPPQPAVPLPLTVIANRQIRGLEAYISNSDSSSIHDNLAPFQNDPPAINNKQCDCNCKSNKPKPEINAPRVKADLGVILQNSYKSSKEKGEIHSTHSHKTTFDETIS